MRLAILGASGHGKVIADTALQAGWHEVVFYDDAWPSLQANGRWPVIGDTQCLIAQLGEAEGVIVGIGNNRVRLQKTRELATCGARLISLMHPDAIVSHYAELGQGSVVLAGGIIQVDCRIGEACIVNTRASIDHDCYLADGVHICPGTTLAGSVSVGEASWIGIGASIKQLICIGNDVTVGAGAAVIADVPDGQTVVGVPARLLSHL